MDEPLTTQYPKYLLENCWRKHVHDSLLTTNDASSSSLVLVLVRTVSSLLPRSASAPIVALKREKKTKKEVYPGPIVGGTVASGHWVSNLPLATAAWLDTNRTDKENS